MKRRSIKSMDLDLLFISIFASFTFSGLVLTVHGNANVVLPSARISLLNLERGHLRTVTDEVNQEVVLTVPTRYFEAYTFECNASYPVEWNYFGEGAPAATADVGRHFKDFYDVKTYTYQTILYMYKLEELQTGRYVCRGSGSEHENLQIHYDLFIPGNGSRILVSTVEKEVFVAANKPLAFIPCPVTNPNAILTLFKGDNHGSFKQLHFNQSIMYHPRKGFRLKLLELPDPFGTYVCTTEDNQQRKIHFIEESLKATYDSSDPLFKKIPIQFTYDYEQNRMLCCSGTPYVPKLQWGGCGSVLDCKIKSVCFEEDRCEPRLGSSGYIPSKWLDAGPLPKGCAGWKLRDDQEGGDNGIFKCSTPGISHYQPYLLNRGNVFLEFDKAPASEMILSLKKTTNEPTYVGSGVEYHCNSTRFFFAFGIRWAFQRNNGDIEFLDDSSDVIMKDQFFLTAHRRQTTFKIRDLDIKAIICFVPTANSATEWRTVSLPILIHEAFQISAVHTAPAELPEVGIPQNLSAQHLYNHPTVFGKPKQEYFNYQTANDKTYIPRTTYNSAESLQHATRTRPFTQEMSHDSNDNMEIIPAIDYNPTYHEIPTQTPTALRDDNDIITGRPDIRLSLDDDSPAGYLNIFTNQYEPISSVYNSQSMEDSSAPKLEEENGKYSHSMELRKESLDFVKPNYFKADTKKHQSYTHISEPEEPKQFRSPPNSQLFTPPKPQRFTPMDFKKDGDYYSRPEEGSEDEKPFYKPPEEKQQDKYFSRPISQNTVEENRYSKPYTESVYKSDEKRFSRPSLPPFRKGIPNSLVKHRESHSGHRNVFAETVNEYDLRDKQYLMSAPSPNVEESYQGSRTKDYNLNSRVPQRPKKPSTHYRNTEDDDTFPSDVQTFRDPPSKIRSSIDAVTNQPLIHASDKGYSLQYPPSSNKRPNLRHSNEQFHRATTPTPSRVYPRYGSRSRFPSSLSSTTPSTTTTMIPFRDISETTTNAYQTSTPKRYQYKPRTSSLYSSHNRNRTRAYDRFTSKEKTKKPYIPPFYGISSVEKQPYGYESREKPNYNSGRVKHGRSSGERPFYNSEEKGFRNSNERKRLNSENSNRNFYKTSEDLDVDASDDKYFYHRYAAESEEFPLPREPVNRRHDDGSLVTSSSTLLSYDNENRDINTRRSGFSRTVDRYRLPR